MTQCSSVIFWGLNGRDFIGNETHYFKLLGVAGVLSLVLSENIHENILDF